MSNIQIAQEIYQAFGRGEVPTILSHLSETVDWEYDAGETDTPWLKHRTGHEGAAAFFASLAEMEIHSFAVKTLLETGNVIVALVDIEFTVRATGRRVAEDDEAHIWHFDAKGKVARFRHRVHTQRHALAWNG
ncbi:MAG: nuclear transport factor 2 family protein [candidate division Zixibacteria bacterium]|nr:nuclear transport factor 2 family protein [candidate division Zixibacteria bacterium]